MINKNLKKHYFYREIYFFQIELVEGHTAKECK